MTSPERNPLESALSTVSVHANSVWWPEGQDSYRLANLTLWLECLKSGLQDNRFRRGGPDPELPDPAQSGPWSRAHSWPSALQRSYTQIAETVNESIPFKIQTIEELKLYRKISKESVKNIWSKPEPEQRKKDPLLNVNVPEFYPSVLFHHADYPMPLQPYPTITDHTYQTDLFPYLEQSSDQDAHWRHAQMAAFPRQSAGQGAEWYGRSGTSAFPNVLLLQRTQRQQQVGPAGLQQSAVFGGPPRVNAFHHQSQQVILSSDFPELPNTRGSDQSVRPGRPTNCPDVYPFSGPPCQNYVLFPEFTTFY